MTSLPELRTERLLLRPFQPDDVEDVLSYRNDPEFVRYLPHIPLPFTRENAQHFIAGNIGTLWEKAPVFALVIDGVVIGNVNLEIEPDIRAAMLGYAIGRTWWGRGLAFEATRKVIAWAQSEFGLVRIWASTDIANTRSRRVLEKLGMQRETVRISDHIGRSGRMVDEIVYGLRVTPASEREPLAAGDR